MSSVKVVVRVRPFNQRELAKGSRSIVSMQGSSVILTRPFLSPSSADSRTGSSTDESSKSFTYDNCYWSFAESDPHFASQETVYNGIGKELLDHSLEGYNTCIFAYGQTGSGKSYSMMGYKEQKGIIPRVCDELFARINNNTDPHLTFGVEVSYMEIYNERVRDLLNPGNKGNLKVREHPSLGPYVEDLTKLIVSSYEDIAVLMDEGNKARTVASTNMNATSSRSHAVFTIVLTQRLVEPVSGISSEKISRICLVDLAGSERADATGATGLRLKEGANINKSLTTLGKVISALADASSIAGRRESWDVNQLLSKRRGSWDVSQTSVKRSSYSNKSRNGNAPPLPAYIPYRDSVLTWLLKDCLGGNSKTVMIAAISPADVNYDETLSTLRYAERAKRIVNKAVVNEDANGKLMRDLQAEVALLKAKLRFYEPELEAESTLSSANGRQDPRVSARQPEAVAALKEELKANEKLMAEITESFEEKLRKTHQIQQQREKALADLGISIHGDTPAKKVIGVQVPKNHPHLVNLNEDPLMSECLLYQLPPGIHEVGDRNDADIRLSGENILPDHCRFIAEDGVVRVEPKQGALLFVNGTLTTAPKRLRSGYRIILGSHHVFRFNHPEEARQERKTRHPVRRHLPPLTTSPSHSPIESDFSPLSASSISDRSAVSGIVDWNFALREREAVMYARTAEIPYAGYTSDLDQSGELDAPVPMYREQTYKRVSIAETDEAYDTYSEASRFSGTQGESREKPITYRKSLDGYGGHIVGNYEGSDRHSATSYEYETDTERMRRLIESQRRTYEAKLRRMARKSERSGVMSEKQKYLLRDAISKWRSRQFIKLSEELVSRSSLLKEANVIARELGKDVLYQFVLFDGRVEDLPVSFWETPIEPSRLPQPAELSHQQASNIFAKSSIIPTLAIKVLDARNNSIYYWTLQNITKRLDQMRTSYNFQDQPSAYLSQHSGQEDDAFFQADRRPWFDFIGNIWICMRNLMWGVTREVTCDIVDGEGRTKGWAKLVVSLIGSERSEIDDVGEGDGEESDGESGGFDDDGSEGKRSAGILQEGGDLLFEVAILEVGGISEAEYTQLHVQFRLNSFGVDGFEEDRVYATDPVTDFEAGPALFEFTQTVRLTVTSAVKDMIANGMVKLEVFGRRQQDVQSMIEEEFAATGDGSTISKSDSPVLDMMTSRFATDVSQTSPSSSNPLATVHRHDILAQIQITEFSRSVTDFRPCPVETESKVETGTFLLRQGLQRRFVLNLSHNSGKEFPWKKLSSIRIGQVRLVDKAGNIAIDDQAVEENMVSLRIPRRQNPIFTRDGQSTLRVECSWDSSLHETRWLDIVTKNTDSVVVRVEWTVEMEGPTNGATTSPTLACRLAEPLVFSADICLRILEQDHKIRSSSRFNLASLVSKPSLLGLKDRGAIMLESQSMVFNVAIRADEWSPGSLRRQKSVKKTSGYVRGEECLQGWKPRGVDMIVEWWKTRRRIQQRVEVERVRQGILEEIEIGRQSTIGPVDGENNVFAVAGKCLEIWRRKDLGDLSLDRLLLGRITSPSSDTSVSPKTSPPALRWIAEISPAQSGPVVRRGYMSTPEDSTDTWVKRWFVIRRPYIFIYTSSTETELLSVVGLEGVDMRYSRDLWSILQRQYVFALHTRYTSILLQASTEDDMKAWLNVIDPLHVAVVVSRKGRVEIEGEVEDAV